ncbi:TetR/AcrR family transcriptional regulator [Demequina sp. SO4-13]|uniref:TetR/AcrR family transcriptional regulator n=1 Tax=Demequina sp. SO4-13 TaxID=3401027 RepID=UPI003AF9627E
MTSAPRGTRSDGQRSRGAILAAATALASVDGLSGLTIGRLAARAGMSKSGLYAHFGSKEELQLAAIAEAEAVFEREVLAPAREQPAGVRRICAQTDAYLDYLERRVFPGGCFFAATSAELGGHEGAVGDRLRALNAAALRDLVEQLRIARDAEEIDATSDVEQLAFEIDALMLAAHSAFLLFSDGADLDRARQGVLARLGRNRGLES